jgi:hypothetical protein
MVVCQGGSVVLAPTQEADVVLLLRLDHPRTSLSKKGNEERAATNDKSPVEHGAWAVICSRSVKREEARDGIQAQRALRHHRGWPEWLENDGRHPAGCRGTTRCSRDE